MTAIKSGKPPRDRDIEKRRKRATAQLPLQRRAGAESTYADCHISGLDVLRYLLHVQRAVPGLLGVPGGLR